MGAASAAAAAGAAGPPSSEVAGVREGRLRPSAGASRSSSRSRLDLGAAGAAAAPTFPADFPVAPGDGLTGGGLDVPFAAAGRLVVSSSSELDADSELLSLSCRKIVLYS